MREDDNSIMIGLGRGTEQGPAGESARILELAREGEAWRPSGWGGCQLSPVLNQGNSWVEMIVREGDAAGARLTAVVNERECTSGRDPDRFLHEPLVVETSESLTLYWTAEPQQGDQDLSRQPIHRHSV